MDLKAFFTLLTINTNVQNAGFKQSLSVEDFK